MSPRTDSVYRFGTFEFDPRADELRKTGIKLKLQDQPRQVLLQLLERPGEVVRREQFRSLLWSEDTFVDFETGLNTAVKRLRETIGDSADNPTFIETVPRKGYKFIAPVEVIERNGYKPTGATQPVRHRRIGRSAIGYSTAVLLFLLLALIVWLSLPRVPKVANVVQLTNDAKSKARMNPPVTDGVHLYFIEGGPAFGGSGIAQVSVTGGETTRIETPLKEIVIIYAISPDFSEMLVANGVQVQADPATGRPSGAAELWAQPLPAGTPHRVGKIYASAACYTPDGAHILYASGGSLMVVNRDGSNAHELAKVQETVRGLRYSPNGKRIRFSAGAGYDDSSLWEIDANGNNPHPLLPNWKDSPFQCCGTWSPDGVYYFFLAGHGNDQAIWVMPEDRFIFAGGRGKPVRLISGPLRLSAPVSSSDGKKLFVKAQQPRVEPVRYDSKTHRFETYLNGISTSSFEISPDRKWVAYVSYPDMSLWRGRIDGTDKMQLTFPPVRAYGPRWSPDGSQIAYMGINFDRPWSVSVISSSGGLPQSYPGEDPSWLPHGNSIIYTLAKPENYKAPWVGIFLLDLDSGKVSSIPNSEGRFSPRVSPDGRYVAAFSQAATELSLFDSKTNHWSSLAKGELFGYNLWSHDGEYVYMRDNHAGIVRVRIRDAKMEEVVNLKDLPQVDDMYAGWFGLTLECDPIVIRDRSTHEIYALDLR